MNDMLTMSVSGPYSEGVINKLTQALDDLKTDVVNVKAMKSEGLMSAILRVSLNGGQRTVLYSGLAQQFPNLQFFYSPVDQGTENTKVANRVTLVVDCKNRPGIQEELEGIMKQLAYTVEKREYTRCHVAGIGETVFSARYSLIVPSNLSGKGAADEVEALAPEARVSSI